MSIGLSICGTASYLPSMPPITLALFGAEIDIAYLKWLDVIKLLAVNFFFSNRTLKAPWVCIGSRD